MERILSAIDRGFGSKDPTRPTPRWQLWVAAVMLVLGTALTAVLVFLWLNPGRPPGTPGIQVGATRYELRELAAMLLAAERKGDTVGADQLLARSARVLRTMNERMASETNAMRDCRLAAMHLAVGVVAVGEGGTWQQRSRYEAAMEGCKGG